MGVELLTHRGRGGLLPGNLPDEGPELALMGDLHLLARHWMLGPVGEVVKGAAFACVAVPAQPDVEGELPGPVGSLARVARSFTWDMISSSSALA